MDHKHLTQTLYTHEDFAQYNHGHVKWYKSLRNVTEFDLDEYERHSLPAVDETFKRFDPDRLITVDGRRPVGELFEMVKAKLLVTGPLQRTILPEIVREDKPTVALRPGNDEYRRLSEYYGDTEDESHYEYEYANEIYDEHEENNNDYMTILDERNERIRLESEFGRLCPVNFNYGLYKSGSDRYTVKFMGKLYRFAGPEEMEKFEKFPRQFLCVPRPGLPIRAIFYGPEALAGPAAKSVGNFLCCDLIDVKYIRQRHEENEKRTYVSTIVNSVLKNTRELTAIGEHQSNAINVMRIAVGHWLQLNFGYTFVRDTDKFDFISSTEGSELNGGENSFLEDYSNHSNYIAFYTLVTAHRQSPRLNRSEYV